MNFIYIIPFYNETSILAQTLAILDAESGRINSTNPGYKIESLVLVENGSTDNSFQFAQNEIAKLKNVSAVIYSEKKADKGLAQRRGLLELVKNDPELAKKWIMFCDADMPFMFSDLEAAAKLVHQDSKVDIIIGSKGHPESDMKSNSKLRSLMTFCFFQVRRMVLGLSVRDTQGSLLITGDKAPYLVDMIRNNGFLFPTELVYKAWKMDFKIQEIPVIYNEVGRPSKVRPIRDGLRMLFGLFKIRFGS